MAEPDSKAVKRGLYIFGFALGLSVFFFGVMMFMNEPWLETSRSQRGTQQFIERGMSAAYDWIINSAGPQVGGVALMVLGVLLFGIFFRFVRKIKT